MKVWAESLHAELAIVLIPLKEQVYEMEGPYADTGSIRKVRTMLDGIDVKYLDLYPLMRKQVKQDQADPEERLYWAIDGHWNVKGNAFAGAAVSRYVKKVMSSRHTEKSDAQ